MMSSEGAEFGSEMRAAGRTDKEEEEEEEENEFWWQKGLIQAPRCVVRWDHVDEARSSRGIPEKGRKVTWSELFLDLILVTNIGKLGEAYQQGDLTLLQAVVLYRVIYACWWATTDYAGRFFSDDLIDKYLSTGLLMFLLVVAGLRIGDGYEFVLSATCVARAAGAFHLVVACMHARVVLALPHTRKHMTRHGVYPSLVEALGNLLAPTLFSGSKTSLLVALAAVALFAPVWHGIGYSCFRIPKRDRVPVDVDHLIERRGCLRLILFGEVVTGCTITPDRPLSAWTLTPIALAYLVVLNMKLLAFDVDIVPVKRHTYRVGGYLKPVVYLEAAFFFDVCVAITGSCVKIVLTILLKYDHDTEQMWHRANQAHELLCFTIAFGVLFLTVERLMHDLTHILGHRSLCRVILDHLRPLLRCLKRSTRLSTYYAAITDQDQDQDDQDTVDLRIFLVQLATHAAIFFACIALGLYCKSIDEDSEMILVCISLATMTSVAVVINLMDEVASVATDSVRRRRNDSLASSSSA